MCQKRWPNGSNWRQYMCFVLLLLIVAFVSKSNQQRPINTQQPQPFRYAKSMSENRNNVVSITLPNSANIPKRMHNENTVGDEIQRTDVSNQRSLATVTSHIKQSESRSIEFSLRELQNLLSDLMIVESQTRNGVPIQKRSIDVRSFITNLLFDGKLFSRIQKFTEKFILPTAALKSLVPTGARLFLFKGMYRICHAIHHKNIHIVCQSNWWLELFSAYSYIFYQCKFIDLKNLNSIFYAFSGLKKWMGPIFIGVQIAKTVLLAMFLPSIIGSIGKMVGKGSVCLRVFIAFSHSFNTLIKNHLINGLSHESF